MKIRGILVENSLIGYSLEYVFKNSSENPFISLFIPETIVAPIKGYQSFIGIRDVHYHVKVKSI